MLLAFGMACGLLSAQRSGTGQVVDAAMVDGAATLMTMMYGFSAMGIWDAKTRGGNLLDTGAWFYDVYETADGQHISLGSLEPQFYAEMVKLSGLEDLLGEKPSQYDRAAWPERRAQLADLIAKKTRDEWCEIMEGTDVCFAPVLSMEEAHLHPHNQARQTFVEYEGVIQPAPSPRFSATPPAIQRPPAFPGQHTDEALADWGFDADRIAKLREANAIA
jgi:alpha-methylacyl-CoA racemase